VRRDPDVGCAEHTGLGETVEQPLYLVVQSRERDNGVRVPDALGVRDSIRVGKPEDRDRRIDFSEADLQKGIDAPTVLVSRRHVAGIRLAQCLNDPWMKRGRKGVRSLDDATPRYLAVQQI